MLSVYRYALIYFIFYFSLVYFSLENSNFWLRQYLLIHYNVKSHVESTLFSAWLPHRFQFLGFIFNFCCSARFCFFIFIIFFQLNLTWYTRVPHIPFRETILRVLLNNRYAALYEFSTLSFFAPPLVLKPLILFSSILIFSLSLKSLKKQV